MAKVNSITITGRLGTDPRIQINSSGEKFMATFNIANTSRWKNKMGEYEENTNWFSVMVYNKSSLNFIEKNFTKGSKVLIRAPIQNSNHEYVNEKGYKINDKLIIIGNYNHILSLVSNKLSNHNTIDIEGNIGRDPQPIFNTDGEENGLIFNIAHNYNVKVKNSNTFEQKTMWLTVLFKDKNKIAYIKKYIPKGTRVLIHGQITKSNQEYKSLDGKYTVRDTMVIGYGITPLSALDKIENKNSSEKIKNSFKKTEGLSENINDFDDDLDLF